MKPYYEDGSVTIYHGDALAVLAVLPSASVEMAVADPPYSSGGFYRGDRTGATSDKYASGTARNANLYDNRSFSGDNRDQRAYGYWSALWMGEVARVLKPSELVMVFTDWRQIGTTTDAIQAGGFIYRGIVVWDKTTRVHHNPGRFAPQAEFLVWGSNGARPINDYDWALRGVFTHPAPLSSKRQHMTEKPVGLMAELLRAAPLDGVVLDPFIGSGSTLVAARSMGLRAIGVEAEERYCEIAARRCQQEVLGLTA